MPNIRLLIYITLFTTVVFVTQSFSQPADVYGWRGAKWGMTKQQIQDVFGDEVSEYQGNSPFQGEVNNAELFINDLPIENSSYKAIFVVDAKSKLLKWVYIEPKNLITAIVSMKELDEKLTQKSTQLLRQSTKWFSNTKYRFAYKWYKGSKPITNMKVLAIANHKRGVGKNTTAVNIDKHQNNATNSIC